MERFILSPHVKRPVHLPVHCTVLANLGSGNIIGFSAALENASSHDFFCSYLSL